jgi:hypothetical protein
MDNYKRRISRMALPFQLALSLLTRVRRRVEAVKP